MRCLECGSEAVTERPERTAQGYRRFRCRACGKQFNERSCCAPRFAETPFKAEMIRRRVTMTTETAASGEVGLGRGGRMSRKRKRDAVLRLLRGEDLEVKTWRGSRGRWASRPRP